MIKCQICNKLFKSYMSLVRHFTQSHDITSKEYYDDYIKNDENFCVICGNITLYRNITIGYNKTCSWKCMGIYNRFQLKNNDEAFKSFTLKVSNNQKHIWLNRDDDTKNTIFNKSSNTNRENIKLLTKEQRAEKFGWLNKLEGDERKQKINEMLFGLRKWWANATLEQKLLTIENVRKSMLGDRYIQNIYEDFIFYKYSVYSQSNITYKKHKNLINPNNYKRGQGKGKHQLDHKYSLVQGYTDKIPIEVMSSIYNLEMLLAVENNKKRAKCSISKEKLYESCKNII